MSDAPSGDSGETRGSNKCPLMKWLLWDADTQYDRRFVHHLRVILLKRKQDKHLITLTPNASPVLLHNIQTDTQHLGAK